MRQVSKQVLTSFLKNQPMRCGNTWTDGTNVYLHNNKIIRRMNNAIEISFCGWATNTTQERVNSLCELINNTRPFKIKKGEIYVNKVLVDSNSFLKIT